MQNIFKETKTDIDFICSTWIDFPVHIHNDIELIYIRKGSVTAFCNGKRYDLKAGSFFLVFPNQVHRYVDCERGVEYIMLIVKPSRIIGYSNLFYKGIPESNAYYIQNEYDKGIVVDYETAFGEYVRYGDSNIITGYFTVVLGKLLKRYNILQTNTTGDGVFDLLKFCADNHKEEISVDIVSSALSLSRSHISHTFNERLNMKFCEYINSLRLTDAVRLLEDTDIPLTDVAGRSGFGTIRTFNRVFKKKYGISPSEYRRGIKLE